MGHVPHCPTAGDANGTQGHNQFYHIIVALQVYMFMLHRIISHVGWKQCAYAIAWHESTACTGAAGSAAQRTTAAKTTPVS